MNIKIALLLVFIIVAIPTTFKGYYELEKQFDDSRNPVMATEVLQEIDKLYADYSPEHPELKALYKKAIANDEVRLDDVRPFFERIKQIDKSKQLNQMRKSVAD